MKSILSKVIVASLVLGLTLSPALSFAGSHRSSGYRGNSNYSHSNNYSHGNNYGYRHSGYRHSGYSNGWETAGAIVATVAGIAILSEMLNPQPTVVYTTPVYQGAPVYQTQRWVPGHYETVYQQVWVQETYTQRYVEPQFGWTWINGVKRYVQISGGTYERIVIPGHYENQPVSKWIEGYWTY
jgi:hypothetical protein